MFIIVMLISNTPIISMVKSLVTPTIFVDPPNISGDGAPAPGSVVSLNINVSDIPDTGLWGYEFYLSLNSTVFPPIVPLSNMNFTADATGWSTTVTRTSGKDSYGYSAFDGNPSPGSGVGSHFVRANSTNSQVAQITFITEQTFTWTLGTPVSALLSFAYKISGNSIASTGNSMGIRVIKPSGAIKTLIPTRSFVAIKPWAYNFTATSATAFDETGTYRFQLRAVLKTAATGTSNYVQVNWDDIGLELAPVSVSEGSFLTSDARNVGKTYFIAKYFREGYVYVADSLTGQPYADGFPITGSGNLVSVKVLAGYGSTALDLYNTKLLTLGYPPSYPSVPIEPHAVGDGWFSNEQTGDGLSSTSSIYSELEPSIFSTPKLKVETKGAYIENINETVVPLGLMENYQKVRVLVAGDEEFTSRTWGFAIGTGNEEQLSWQGYAERQIRYASYYFNVNFDISLETVAYTTWMSDNSVLPVSSQNLVNVQTQLGWTGQTPFYFQGTEVDVLVAITGQNNSGPLDLAGKTDPQKSVVLIQPQAWWADDNLIQHEVSHLYDAPDHDEQSDPGYDADCIMTYREEYVGNHYDNGYTIEINANVPWTYVTHNYHNECYNTIYVNRFRYGIWVASPPHDPNYRGGGSSGERPKLK